MRALHDYRAIRPVPVSLEEVLAARDRRQGLQSRLLHQTDCPLITMTLNLPGAYKRIALSSFFFDCQKTILLRGLRGLGAELVDQVTIRESTGDEWVVAVRGLSPLALKSLTLELENVSESSRLLDLDVLDRDGQPVDRSHFDLPSRSCFLCDQPAKVCAAARTHPLASLHEHLSGLLSDYLEGTLTDKLVSLAAEASSFELMTAPEPGLVTPFKAGSHQDMDRFTFIRSQAALIPYYRQAFLAGWEDQGSSALRLQGILAEASMKEETGGVNTHRGWIYASGILLASAGRYCARIFFPAEGSNPLPPLSLSTLSAHLAQDLENSVAAAPLFENLSGSLDVKGKEAGIRREALLGFPSVFELGAPILRQALVDGHDENAAGRRALLALLATADDSTLRKRGGEAQAERIRQFIGESAGFSKSGPLEAMRALSSEQLDFIYQQLEDQFDAERLTCGGAADLLAASRLVDRFFSLCLGEEPNRLSVIDL